MDRNLNQTTPLFIARQLPAKVGVRQPEGICAAVRVPEGICAARKLQEGICAAKIK